jgi:Tfp pilus assembly protein PilV
MAMSEVLVVMLLAIAFLVMTIAVALAESAIRRARRAEKRALEAEANAAEWMRIVEAQNAARRTGRSELVKIHSLLKRPA